jgi:hypothetical protein
MAYISTEITETVNANADLYKFHKKLTNHYMAQSLYDLDAKLKMIDHLKREIAKIVPLQKDTKNDNY